MSIVLHSRPIWEAFEAKQEPIAEADPAHYREFVFRTALAICCEPDGAEDVTQEVLLILFRSRAKLAKVEHRAAWVRRVTVRSALKYLSRNRQHALLTEDVRAGSENADSIAVFLTLARLTPEQRVLLGMAIKQGLSYREIGEALGIPEGTVASRLSAAKKAFQRMWEL
ncbi:MAG: sigma-70 family RNA polymerase sigma factor [Fimbriimonas sp.]|nr:sigma-70 family RNA polymerase sigma factor [Fimbriimonas sp.]